MSRGFKQKKNKTKKTRRMCGLKGLLPSYGCLLGLHQLPAGCGMDNSWITHRCRQAEPLVHKEEEEGRRPIFSVQEHRALCAHLWPVCCLAVLARPGHRRDDSLPPFAIFHFSLFVCFFFRFLPPPPPNLSLSLLKSSRSESGDAEASSRVPLYPAAVARRASPASRPDQSKEIPHGIKQGGRNGGTNCFTSEIFALPAGRSVRRRRFSLWLLRTVILPGT